MDIEFELYTEAMKKRLTIGFSMIPFDEWKETQTSEPINDLDVECGDGVAVVDIQRFNKDFGDIFGK